CKEKGSQIFCTFSIVNVLYQFIWDREGILTVVLVCASPSRNCMDAYPTFLAVMWCAGLCLRQAPAAFAGIIYLVVRQKYFVGYMGQTSQSTPGYLFGKRVLFFLILMCIVGIFNYLLARYFGSDYKEYVETVTNAASALLLIP
uniref:Arachidonate 5-lipoxygenase-activating protein n=1 Tax=Myripristis murdjan TaxID=586833 RepID=A0A667XDF0_9TELE